MKNKTSAIEWLSIASHDLGSAKILINANHFTDSIGSDLQQGIEKTLKYILAAYNKKIPRVHDLSKVYFLLNGFIQLSEEEMDLLDIATDYYRDDKYPSPIYQLPTMEEIKEVYEFAMRLFNEVLEKLNIKGEVQL
jgi:HEPN domain-containing protein